MTLNDARKHLDRLREGHPMPVSLTTKALLLTGDIPRISHPTLCFYGNEQSDYRPCEAHDQAAEVGFSYSQYLDKKTH